MTRADPILRLFDGDHDTVITLVYVREWAGQRLHEYHVESELETTEVLALVSSDGRSVQFVGLAADAMSLVTVGDVIQSSDEVAIRSTVQSILGMEPHG